MHTSKLLGSKTFWLFLSETGAIKQSLPNDNSVDLTKIPEEYYEFTDVFSKKKANTLVEHCPYDLKINLKEDAASPIEMIYSLSPLKLKALQKFINENVTMGFIRPTHSSHGAPILFIKKKDGSLQLCVDFCGLNRITKKDRYPLPLITNLLNTFQKGCW